MSRPKSGQGGRWIAAALARLGQVLPDQAERASATLCSVLHPLQRSPWPELAWSFSQLGAAGCPVELVWRPGEPTIGWTSEVSGPSTRETRRLSLAVRRLQHLKIALPPQACLAALGWAQSHIDLNWGAWLGAKHKADKTDSFKLYAEIGPEGLSPLYTALGGWVAACEGRDLRLLGLSPEGMTEFYGRLGDGDMGWLAALAAKHGLRESVLNLLDQAERLIKRPSLRRKLEESEAGWSLAFAPDGSLLAMALFFKPGFYAVHARQRDQALGSLTTGSPSDAAWIALLEDGLCQPSILGLAASAHGVTSQMALVHAKRHPDLLR
jgi:hypothetical protein